MKLSIIIPFYKGDAFLPTLLSSLDNSYGESNKLISAEVIIVIDSTETSCKDIIHIREKCITEKMEVYVLKNEQNTGVDRSRDKGMNLATGDFITFIDQDDYVSNSYFKVLEQNLYAQKYDVFFLNGNIKNLADGRKLPVYYYMPSLRFKSIITSNHILSPSFLVLRKELLTKHNIHFSLPFTQYKGIDDWYFYMQLTSIHNLKYKKISQYLINYCIHTNNYSHNVQRQMDGAIFLLNSLKTINKQHQKYLAIAKKVFEFSKIYISQGKIKAICKHPIKFCLFILYYLIDFNRAIRCIHKQIIHFKIRK